MTNHVTPLNTPPSSQLRKSLRRQRLTLSRQQRALAANQATRHLYQLPRHYRKPQAKVAVFVDAFGELPTQPLIHWAYQQGFAVYLPVVTKPHAPLSFVRLQTRYLLQARLARHRFGMRQPASGRRLSAHQLDMVFLPLVAFDKQGYRMGMGGGFYDRTLARTKAKPLKIGWAYDFQQVDNLAPKPWDVRLDRVITPSGVKRFCRYLANDVSKSNKDKLDKPHEPTDRLDQITEPQLATVIKPERFHQLIADAEAFLTVNADNGDSFF